MDAPLSQEEDKFVVRVVWMLKVLRLYLRKRYISCLINDVPSTLMYYLHYPSWASFHAFHAPSAFGVIYSRGLQLLYGFFWAGINAIIACTTIANHCYKYGFVVSIFLHLV